MRVEINFETYTMDERSAKLFGYLVARAAQEGGVIVLSESSGGEHIGAYHFGKEAPDSDMFAGSAFGTGDTLADALAGILDDLGVDARNVEILP